jgi:hypothetical protein
MWDPHSPLQQYMELQFKIKKNSNAPDQIKWAALAPLYASYGNWLIRTYPIEFAQYYLWPNAIKYYTPPVEFLQTYNMGIDSVVNIARTWFGYKNSKVKTVFKDFNVSALDFYPILIGALNVIFLLSFLAFLLLDGHKKRAIPSSVLCLIAGLWLINFGFSVFASPIALRFQVFPVLVFISAASLLLEYVWKEAFTSHKTTI